MLIRIELLKATTHYNLSINCKATQATAVNIVIVLNFICEYTLASICLKLKSGNHFMDSIKYIMKNIIIR